MTPPTEEWFELFKAALTGASASPRSIEESDHGVYMIGYDSAAKIAVVAEGIADAATELIAKRREEEKEP